MDSTMQDFPLTITAIMRHGCGVHGARTVTTATGDGYRHISYRELGQRAAQLANALRRLGVTGDQRVATFMWNNAEHLAAYFAVPSMGAVLHTLNIRLFPEQIAFVANEAEDQIVLVDASLIKLLEPVLGNLETVHTVIVVGDGDMAPIEASGKAVLRYAELIDAESPDFEWPPIDENSAAAMCYTSGTTGNPKGVVYSHRSTFLHAMGACTTNGIGVGAIDSVLPIVPMFHANAWGLPYAALMAGADLVLPDCHLGARSLIDMVEKLRPTVAGAVPTIWNDVMCRLEEDPDHDISSLRFVVCGGSAMPRSMIKAFVDMGVTVRHAWGMTEMSPIGTLAVAKPPFSHATDDEQLDILQTQGYPPFGVQMKITDDAGKELPWDGKTFGRLKVSGPAVAKAYFRVDADILDEDDYFDTGDVATIDAHGYMRITDRSKDVIKSGGEWISSIDLENLAIGHPAVAEAAVIGVYHPKWDERPLLIVQLKQGAKATREEILKFMDGKIAKWWMPDDVAFVEGIPHTATGKILKTALREQFKAYRFPNAAA